MTEDAVELNTRRLIIVCHNLAGDFRASDLSLRSYAPVVLLIPLANIKTATVKEQ